MSQDTKQTTKLPTEMSPEEWAAARDNMLARRPEPEPDDSAITKGMRWNLPPGGDNACGPRASDGAITGIDGPDPSATPQRHADPHWAICPWCGYKHGDGWEWAKQRTVKRCADCDNMFTVDPEYSVTFHTFVAGNEKAHCK